MVEETAVMANANYVVRWNLKNFGISIMLNIFHPHFSTEIIKHKSDEE